MSNRLKQKNAIITGGTTGIGFEAATQYLAQGARVLITGRSPESVEKAVAQLGPGAHGIAADASKLKELDKLAERAAQLFDKVDILLVNAGNGVFSPLSEVNEDLFDHQFDLNVKGAFFTVQKLQSQLRDGSSVILTSSAVNSKGAPGGSLYFATKAAVRSFVRSLATELGQRGIRVNSLSPGLVPTRFFHNSNVGPEAYAGFHQMIEAQAPLGRAGTPREIADAALFLGSDESSYVTAADLVVDGGWRSV